MTISEIGIKKFRSIDICWVSCKELCAFVGSNNVGKSTLLRALNAFFNYAEEEPFFKSGTHKHSPKSIPKIDVVFSNVPNKRIYNEIKSSENEIHLRLTFDSSKLLKEKYQIKKDGKYSELSSYIQNELKKDIQFVYIPASRDYTQTVFNEKSILKELLDVYLKKHTEKRNRIKPKVEDTISFFNNNALKKASKDLLEFYPLKSSFSLQIDYDSNDLDYHILLRDLCIKVKDNGNEFKLIDTGSGIQSLMNIAIYRYIAKLKHKKYILGIEEPELNLHPQSQKELISGLRKSSEDENLQIFFTTHSAVVIDQLSHTEILSFKRIQDLKRGFKADIKQIPFDFWNRYDLDYEGYYQFYQYHNSEFFFANYVIICEGKGDAEAIKHILNKSNIDINLEGISILTLNGVQDLKYPYYLLKHLSIPFITVVDKDFFLPYFDGEKKTSRTPAGYFKYKEVFQTQNLSLIKDIIPQDQKRSDLLNALFKNHTNALNILEGYNVVCMRFTLEMDLVASDKACEKYYELLNVPSSNRSPKYLLENNHRAIKKPENIIEVLKSIEYKNYPFPLSRIKNMVKNLIKN